MFNIIILDKTTHAAKVIDTFDNEEKAINFCEAWGWIYSDEKGKSYYLDYMEA